MLPKFENKTQNGTILYIVLLIINCSTIGCTSRATLEMSARRLNITICQILCQRWFWEMLQFRRFLELFLLLQLQNHLWYRMGYIVIFKRLAGIPYVTLLVRPMVYIREQYIYIAAPEPSNFIPNPSPWPMSSHLLYSHNNSINHNIFTSLANCTLLLANCTIKTINFLPLIIPTVPIKTFNFLPNTMQLYQKICNNFLTSHHANCTITIFFNDFTWVACFITIHLLSLTSIELTPIFLPLLKMTEVSRNVDNIFLHIFFCTFFY